MRVRNHQPGIGEVEVERGTVVPRTYRGRAEVEVEVERRVEVQRYVQTGNVHLGQRWYLGYVLGGLCTARAGRGVV